MDIITLFSFSSYTLNPLALLNFFITGVVVQLGLAVALEPRAEDEPRQVVINRAWFEVCLAASIWLFCFGMLYLSRNDAVALFWDRVGCVGVMSIPPTFMRFTIGYLGLDRERRLWWLFAAAGVGFILLLPTELVVRGVRHFSWGPYTLIGRWHDLFMVYFMVTMGLSFFFLLRAWLTEKNHYRRRQIGRVFIAFLAADLGAVDFLPSYGIDLLPLGNLAILAFMSVATYFIARHQALRLSPAMAANQILHSMTNLLVGFHGDRRIILVNKSLLQMIGRPTEELIGSPLEQVLGTEVLSISGVWNILDGGGSITQTDLNLTTSEGLIPVGFIFSAVRDGKGMVLGYIGVGWDRRLELERETLYRAKEKMFDHLSHELKTPLAIISSSLKHLKKESIRKDEKRIHTMHEIVDRNLRRLVELENEAYDIVERKNFTEKTFMERIILQCQDLLDTLISEYGPPDSVQNDIRRRIDELYFPGGHEKKEINLQSWIPQVLEEIKPFHRHRRVSIETTLEPADPISIPEPPLHKSIRGLIRNAIENTPDGGSIQIKLSQQADKVSLKIQDFGIGFDEEFRKQIFHGFVHPCDSEDYTSRRPYDFGAGGEGCDLLRTKIFSERFSFGIQVESTPCPHVQNHAPCPGNIATCLFCSSEEECRQTGGSTFTLTFSSSMSSIYGKKTLEIK
jgi:signal transduction histidine kinase